MKKKKLYDQRGITLVEIIIVIAIIGIFASSAVMMLGHLHYANTQKVVKTLDAALDQLQVQTLSKTGKYYMYVYKLSDGYYMRILPDNLSSFDESKLTADGTKLCNNTIRLWGIQAGTPTEIKEKDYYVKVSYTKTALFNSSDTNIDEIEIDGVPKYNLKLVMDTGKHFIN